MTEQNIFQEIEADLQNQRYEELWKKYGMWIVGAAVVVVLATGGVSAWRSWQAEKNQHATEVLFHIMETTAANAEPKPIEQMTQLEDFALKNPNETQAIFAQLDAAAIASSAGNDVKATQLYAEVAQNRSIDIAFRQFADLMIVRAQLDSGDPAQLQKRLDPLVAENAPWRYQALEYSAFLALRMGNKEKAVRLFTELSQDAEVPSSQSARAADMLHYLSE